MVDVQLFWSGLCADPFFAYCSGLYLSRRNDGERTIALANIENLKMCFNSLFAACNYEEAEYTLTYVPFDAHEGGFIVPFPALLT